MLTVSPVTVTVTSDASSDYFHDEKIEFHHLCCWLSKNPRLPYEVYTFVKITTNELIMSMSIIIIVLVSYSHVGFVLVCALRSGLIF